MKSRLSFDNGGGLAGEKAKHHINSEHLEDATLTNPRHGNEKDETLTQEDIDFTIAWENSEQKSKVLKKLDRNILPAFVLIYLMSFLDRGNIGNARIEGLEADLGLSGQQYSWCLSVFFFSYAAFETVGNVGLKTFGARRWLPAAILSWGTVMTLQGIVQGYSGLIATRFFLGMTEAPFFPGAMFLLSNFYRRDELQRRMAYLYAAASIAGAFSGILAFGLAKMDGIAGLAGWRWIFIVEGLATVVVGLFSPFLLHDDVETARFLTPEEKRFLRGRLTLDRQGRVKGDFEWRYLKQAATDYKVYTTALIYFADAVATYGLSFSLPTIITALGYTSARAQLLTIPVYVFASICTLGLAWFGDKKRQRMMGVLISYSICMAGLVICLATPQPRLPGLILFAVFLIAAGAYSVVPAIIAWNANNLSGEWKRSIGIGMQIGICNLGGVVGSNIFLVGQRPRYWLGYGFALGILAFACVLAVFLRFSLARENKRRDSMSESDIRERFSHDEISDLGDKSPYFRYET